jgi:hypothetical protein
MQSHNNVRWSVKTTALTLVIGVLITQVAITISVTSQLMHQTPNILMAGDELKGGSGTG